MDKLKLSVIICVLLLISCSSKDKSDNNFEKIEVQVTNKDEYPQVKTKILSPSDFNLELKTRGKIYAQNKVNLKFKLEEKVTNIYFANGKKVLKGQTIAIQQNSFYKNKIVKANERLERAKIDVEDILIGFNYSIKDSSTIPKEILDMAKNRSNYNTAVSDLKDSKIELASTIMKSPIKGIVANLNNKVHSYPDFNEPFCTIIDNSILEVKFNIIEDDYIFLSKNQPINIHTYLDDNVLKGRITEINPMVDENGMISVKGIVKNPPINIIDGMNVSITIKKTLQNKIYIPKESLVLRDNKSVVFTYKEGRAKWNYVETSYENYENVVIEKGLKKDDEIIYTNNVNLAHNTKVIRDNE